MQQQYCVVIHYGDINGSIEYDSATKTAQVTLADDDKRSQVETYLETQRRLPRIVATGLGLEYVDIKPLDSVENFKIALTKLWETTDVLVDWSQSTEAE